MKFFTKIANALLASSILFLSVVSCNPDDNPPIEIPSVRLCQIQQFFYLNAQYGHEGFPEIFTSPMQYWDFGMKSIEYNKDGYPVAIGGFAPSIWEVMTIAYNPNNTVKSMTLHSFKSKPSEGTICTNDTCEKVWVFSYDNNNNPVKVTGEVRDFYSNPINTFPVCDNEFDINGRLVKQVYANNSYWRFEYNNGNVSKMYFKKPSDNTEQLQYQFLSYDNKMNLTRTNPVWQLYFNTYSTNNPLSYHRFTGKKIPLPTGGFIDEFVDVKIDYTYGANFGRLPTAITFTDVNTGKPFSEYDNFVSYKCEPIPLPGQ